LYLKDAGSPVMIRDLSDKNSFYVVMPMKIWFIYPFSHFKLIFFFSLSNHSISTLIWGARLRLI
jgi:hypothetical protein